MKISPTTLHFPSSAPASGHFPSRAPSSYSPTTCDGKVLTVKVQTDKKPDETSWFVTDSDENKIMSVSNYSSSSQTVSQSVCVGMSPGCFKLTVTDNYGDGILVYDAINAYLDEEEIYTSGSLSSFSIHTADIGTGCSLGHFPSYSPRGFPSVSPSVSASVSPSAPPRDSLSVSPSVSPSVSLDVSPSASPSVSPSVSPSASPSASPSMSPSASQNISPSASPSVSPSVSPIVSPSASPSVSPSVSPSASPIVSPSMAPSLGPSALLDLSSGTSVAIHLTILAGFLFFGGIIFFARKNCRRKIGLFSRNDSEFISRSKKPEGVFEEGSEYTIKEDVEQNEIIEITVDLEGGNI